MTIVDPVVAAAGFKIAEILAEKALKRTLNLGWRRLQWLPVIAIHRSDNVRVSCSAFLRIRDEQHRILLVRNLHRPEFYGPLGGCFKYLHGEGSSSLDGFSYDADESASMPEAQRDIRGYVRRGSAADFFQWFQSSVGRETARDCLLREIREELFEECSLPVPNGFDPDVISFQFVRSFLERSLVSGTKTLQFRLFEVYDLELASSASHALLNAARAHQSDRLIWTTKDEIEIGRRRSDKAVIGHAAVLLVNDRLTRPDLPSRHKR